MLAKSHYLILGIPQNESAGGIRRAFREHVKRYHPDRVGFARARFFQEIVEAYHTLSSPERRRAYDRGLAHAEGGAAAVPAVSLAEQDGAVELREPLDPKSDDPSGRLPQVAPVLRSFSVKDALFEAALAQASRNLTAASSGAPASAQRLSVQIVLSQLEALRGGTLGLLVPSCAPCERCGGSGAQGVFPCDLCDGEGLREEEESVRVTIPPNVGDGTLIEAPLRGLGPHHFYLCVCVRVAS